MPSILAFFDEPKTAYNCLTDIRKIIPHEAKAYTVARQEYVEEEKSISEYEPNKLKIATNIGGLLGVLLGVFISFSMAQNIFRSLSHTVMIVLVLLACGAAGSSIGFIVLLYSGKSSKNYVSHPERKNLMLIVESPGDKKDLIVEKIQAYNPSKLKIY